MFWLQPGGQFVGDQAFDAFAFSASLDKYITSRRVIRTYSQYTTLWAALVLSILGFVLQFVGLRNVHSSVAMFLLVATLIMAVLRASLRSNRLEEKSNRLAEIEKVEGHELDWLACELESSLLAHEDPSPSPDTSKVDVTNSWELPGDDTSKSKLAACPPNHHETTSLLSAEIRKSPQLNQTADKIIQVKEYEEAEGTPQSPDCKWRIVRDGHERVFTIYEEELPYKAFALASSGDAVYDSQFIEGRGFEMIKHRERGEKNSWLPNPAACAMRLRARLATLTGDPATVATKWDINTREVGLKLQNSFCATAEYLLSPHNTWIGPHNCVVFGWSTNSWVGRKGKSLVQYPIHFLLRKQNAKWVTSAEQLEAVVGLWVWSLKETNPHHLRYLFEVLEDEKRRYLATSTLRMWTAQVDISFERGVPTSSSGKLSKHAWFLLADEGGPSQPFPAACFSGSNTTSSPIRGCLLSPYQTNSSNLKAAQSIFAIFIAVISKFVEPLGPEKAIDEWLLKQSSLTGLARLVDIFISAELGNRADALMTIIPPLLASSWLPSINEMMGWAIEQGRLDAVMFLLKSEAVDFKMKDENEETVKERSGTRRGSEIPNIGEIYVQIEKAQGAVEEREKREEEIRVEKRVEQRRAEIEWAEEQEREYWRIRVENGPAWYGI
jgi:hypothetical protein